MTGTTTIRIDRATHEELKRIAQRRDRTVAETVTRAVRALRQEEMGRQLASSLEADEVEWLDARIG